MKIFLLIIASFFMCGMIYGNPISVKERKQDEKHDNVVYNSLSCNITLIIIKDKDGNIVYMNTFEKEIEYIDIPEEYLGDEYTCFVYVGE